MLCILYNSLYCIFLNEWLQLWYFSFLGMSVHMNTLLLYTMWRPRYFLRCCPSCSFWDRISHWHQCFTHAGWPVKFRGPPAFASPGGVLKVEATIIDSLYGCWGWTCILMLVWPSYSLIILFLNFIVAYNIKILSYIQCLHLPLSLAFFKIQALSVVCLGKSEKEWHLFRLQYSWLLGFHSILCVCNPTSRAL